MVRWRKTQVNKTIFYSFTLLNTQD